MRRYEPLLAALVTAALLGSLGHAGIVHSAEPTTRAEGGNRLRDAASPYLRRHAQNPVDWRPYGDEAFRAARESGRPLFVSIGYASCHWCAVMEDESYGDPAVGAAIDAGFVAVKVDREQSPEIAETWARTVAAMGERVGWPLHVFLLPDGTPILGTTYMPRRDRPGRPGILTVLASVRSAAAQHPETLERRAAAIRSAVREALVDAAPASRNAPDADTLRAVVARVLAEADPDFGGRRTLPKRPVDPSVALLLRHHRRSDDARVLEAALTGLERMAAAPIRGADGGFHEAAGSRDWSRPRTERRLSDNATLALAYLEAWQATGDDALRRVAARTLDFVLASLAAPNGGLFASLRGAGDGAQRDEQVLTDAHGRAISALARAGLALEEPRHVEAAREAADFLTHVLRTDGGLHRAWGGGQLGPPARLPDYAYAVAGLLDLLEADPDPRWLETALALQREQDARLADTAGGYFLTAEPPGPGLPRPKHARDQSLPSGNAVAAWNLLRLHALTGEAAWLDRADALLATFAEAMRADPATHAGLAVALDARLDGLHEIAIVVPEGADPAAFLACLRTAFVPNRVLVVATEGREQARLAEVAPLIASKRALGGGVTAFVCRDQLCEQPARTPDQFAAQLARFAPLIAPATAAPD